MGTRGATRAGTPTFDGAQMPWLTNMIEQTSGELSLAELPVRCLCDYLLTHVSTQNARYADVRSQ
jgi:hypothetical protein